MAYTESSMLPLGTQAPDFTLFDTVSGVPRPLKDMAGAQGTVVMFLCNHCPYVLHVNEEIVRIAQQYQTQGIGFVAISSNDVDSHPEDAPDKMREQANAVGYSFPYLYDETQEVAKAYDAACTPDFYVFDANLRLYYRGQLDDSRPKRNPTPVTGADLRAALEALLHHQTAPDNQRPSGGCNIKWKSN
ncbi:MAG: thioredoxin family protein [Bacteroidetes bacterium]|nr:thioredoxin family protein [Bacteroidota bacterium]